MKKIILLSLINNAIAIRNKYSYNQLEADQLACLNNDSGYNYEHYDTKVSGNEKCDGVFDQFDPKAFKSEWDVPAQEN